jgi:hypothetical protein
MVNYNNTKIFKIVNNIDDNIIINYTTLKYLSSKFQQFKNQLNNNKYATNEIIIYINKYGLENCKLELLENISCNNIDELNKQISLFK